MLDGRNFLKLKNCNIPATFQIMRSVAKAKSNIGPWTIQGILGQIEKRTMYRIKDFLYLFWGYVA